MKTIEAKNFLTKTNLGGSDLTVNPYFGCSHGCTYCYAKTLPMHKKNSLDWGAFVYERVFPNYDIKKGTGKKKLVLCSMTDPYQKIESHALATRRILDQIKESELEVSILTKSSLVTRDIDLFRQMQSIEVGFSIGMLDENAKIFEPGASLPSERIEALKELKKNGIKTYVFISPILPFVSDVMNIIQLVKDDVDYLMFDRLNLKDEENRVSYYSMIRKYYPNLLNETMQLFEQKDYQYYKDLKKKIIAYTKQFHIEVKYIFS